MKTNQFLTIFFKHFPMFHIIPVNNFIDLMNDLKRSRTEIGIKVNKVHESLKETSIIIDEIESDFLERSKKLDKLKEEYDRLSKLSEIEEEKANAIIDQFEHSIGKRSKKDLWMNIIISITIATLFFILGILIGS